MGPKRSEIHKTIRRLCNEKIQGMGNRTSDVKSSLLKLDISHVFLICNQISFIDMIFSAL